MNINNYIEHIEASESLINNDGNFIEIHFDSRKVKKGDLFVAIKGTISDGHKYIDQVIEKGAKVIICETLPEEINNSVSYIKTSCSSKALGILASEYYGNPSSKLRLIGITGTNGKTTIASTLFNLVRSMGYKAGLISTIEVVIENNHITATHTTPDQLCLNKYLSDMVDSGCDYCLMEVSSHSIVQNRIAGLNFCGGVFTNITHDHLDFHKTFKEYIRAKQIFFDQLPSNAFAITNNDDKNGQIMIQNTAAKKYSYSLKSVADFKAAIIESHF